MTSSAEPRRPELAIVLCAEGDGWNLATTLKWLRRQTIAPSLEVILASPAPEQVVVAPEDGAAFHDVRVIDLKGERSLSLARAEGARAATADFVGFGEDHCLPDPRWAETLLARLREGYTAVGPRMVNANPGSVLSWASFLGAYGGWCDPVQPGKVETVPGHNSAYRRDALLACGAELHRLLQAETVMHWEMARRGATFYLEPAATSSHFNISRLGPLLMVRMQSPRMFTAVWSRHWPVRKRLWFALISPLMSLRRIGPMRQRLRQIPDLAVSRARVEVMLVISLLLGGIAYSLGFLVGCEDTGAFEWNDEIDRSRFLNPADRALFAAQ